jgi:rhamnulokinase
LWLVQECRRAWGLEGMDYSYADLTRMASVAKPFAAVIQPDHFLEPGGRARIAEYCRLHGSRCQINRVRWCVMIPESLALRYRQVPEGLEAIPAEADVIHIVGGGSELQC